MAQNEIETIKGSVETVVFAKEDGFTVIDLNCNGELITAVGIMPELHEAEELELTGYFTSHSVYGYQFKVETFSRTLPTSIYAIERYLASGTIKGIGPSTAKKIVETFGEETLNILEEYPERLAEIKGISPKKANDMAEQFKQMFGIRSLMLFLAKYNISPAQIVLVWKRWGGLAIDMLRDNPYILCDSGFNVDFKKIDEMAEDFEIPKNHYNRIKAGFLYVIKRNLNNGHTCLPKEKTILPVAKFLGLDIEEVSITLDDLIENKEIQLIEKNKHFIALPEVYQAEEYIASRILLMCSIPSEEISNVDFIINEIEKDRNITYEKLQKKAIYKASQNDIFILTGGPGTGKTTTLNGIIEVLEYLGKDIGICAPTGRAAKRISEITGREAKTIHRLLEVEYIDGVHKFTRNEHNPLEHDVVVIDEMSMVDSLLFANLLKAIKPKAKLVLVGDYNQLPSVGAGNVLHDLLDSDIVPTVCLEQIFRQSQQSLIVTNAHRIVNGQMPVLDRKDTDFFFMPKRDVASTSMTVHDLVCTRLPNAYEFSPIDDIQVLCPQRGGNLGVEQINKLLQNTLNPSKNKKNELKTTLYTFREGDKVMQTKNNYDIEWVKDEDKGTGIFNGDIGVIKIIDRASGLMMIDFEGRIATYPFDLAIELELAYAITIHKSQGSEFEAVIIPLMKGYEKLYYRNLLYTAITRAKKILIIVGSQNVIEYMVSNVVKSKRFTNLKYLLDQGNFM